MPKERDQKNEKVIWDTYLEKCKQEGKEPTANDFAAWAKSLMVNS